MKLTGAVVTVRMAALRQETKPSYLGSNPFATRDSGSTLLFRGTVFHA